MVSFRKISEHFNTIEKTSSRNEMSLILSNLLKELDKNEASILCYLVQGRVAPLFVKSEFNFSQKSFLKILEILHKEKLGKKYMEMGDIGTLSEYVSEILEYKESGLSLIDLYNSLWEIVKTQGTGSSEKKFDLIIKLLKRMSPLESKFLARIICGELRLGFSSKSVLDSISIMLSGDKGLREQLDRAYGVSTDLGYICSLAKENESKLSTLKITPGVPVLSRLVERVGSFEEVIERLGDSFFVQPKFDGLRCQIHKYRKDTLVKDNQRIWCKHISIEKQNGLFKNSIDEYEVRLFTRNLEDVTEMFPEIVESAMNVKKESFVLDSEVLGWNYKDDRFLSYQETMQRRRKYGIKGKQEDIPVKAFVFDILYLNDVDLSEEDTEKRIRILDKDFKHLSGSIEICLTKVINGQDELINIFNENVQKGLEGIIVKQFNGSYLPGVRNYEWIKLKKSMEKKLVDTIDLVAIGYYSGFGKRGKIGIGAVLGALYNDKDDRFEGICKVGTGFSDEQLKNTLSELEMISLRNKPKNVEVDELLKPDVWVEPKIVFSVESDEITRNIKANINIGSGLSLRFPRLIEWGRDKGPEEATTAEELEHLYSIRKPSK
ncbi:MAG: ATP-dependent DNA ligase [Candidatus Dojkabacteria bacterium]|nr:ATP-dependent DNA ligase [Candidatus Dojkabacteria bacterium]